MPSMWMRMLGQTWLGAAASFLGTWTTMMVAMMLPSLAPLLFRYRQAIGTAGGARLDQLTALVGLGYFIVWTAFGLLLYSAGVAVAAIRTHVPLLARAAPIGVAIVALGAGALQFTAWRGRHLACYREALARSRAVRADAGWAWRHGLRVGV